MRAGSAITKLDELTGAADGDLINYDMGASTIHSMLTAIANS